MRMFRHRAASAGQAGGIPALIPFGTGRDFGRGVEFGLLFARLKDYGRVEIAVHADMAELVIRAAESQGKTFSGSPHEHDGDCRAEHGDMDADWLDVVIG